MFLWSGHAFPRVPTHWAARNSIRKYHSACRASAYYTETIVRSNRAVYRYANALCPRETPPPTRRPANVPSSLPLVQTLESPRTFAFQPFYAKTWKSRERTCTAYASFELQRRLRFWGGKSFIEFYNLLHFCTRQKIIAMPAGESSFACQAVLF